MDPPRPTPGAPEDPSAAASAALAALGASTTPEGAAQAAAALGASYGADCVWEAVPAALRALPLAPGPCAALLRTAAAASSPREAFLALADALASEGCPAAAAAAAGALPAVALAAGRTGSAAIAREALGVALRLVERSRAQQQQAGQPGRGDAAPLGVVRALRRFGGELGGWAASSPGAREAAERAAWHALGECCAHELSGDDDDSDAEGEGPTQMALACVRELEAGGVTLSAVLAECSQRAWQCGVGPKPLAPYAPPEDSEDSEDSEAEEEGDQEDQEDQEGGCGSADATGVPLRALGCYAFFADVPSALRPAWALQCALPAVVDLLERGPGNAPALGWALLRKLLGPVARSSLNRHGDGAGADVGALCAAAARAMVQSMATCPDARAREGMKGVLGRLVGCACADVRWELLRAMLAGPAVPPLVASTAVGILRREVDAAWGGTGADAALGSAFFASPKLLELLPLFMVPGRVTERRDVVVEAISLYRYLLIKDRARRVTGVWAPAHINEVEDRFLRPLREEVERLRDEFRAAGGESDGQLAERAQMLGGCPMTPAEFREANGRVVTSLELLLDLVARVHELVDTLPDQP
eukprot:m51a1_g8512 hypothetical protein (592) ;mRNA; r:80516-82640